MSSSSLSVGNFNFSITGSDSNKIFILFIGRSSYMNKNLNFLELISFKKKLTTNIFMTSHRGIFDIIDSKLTPLLLVLKIHQTQKNLFIHRILRKIIKSRVWDHPGGSRGRLGDQFGPRAAQGSKRAPKRCETLIRFWHKNGDPVQLFVVFFCLRCSRCRFFVILGARGLHFGFHFGFTLRALGLWENS